jgi:alpha-glucosidase
MIYRSIREIGFLRINLKWLVPEPASKPEPKALASGQFSMRLGKTRPAASAVGSQTRSVTVWKCVLGILVSLLTTGSSRGEERHILRGPSGTVQAVVTSAGDGRLTFEIQDGNSIVIHPSPLGIVVDGIDLGQKVRIGTLQQHSIREQFACHGVKSTGRNECIDYAIPIHHAESKTTWELEVRVFHDGVAYRYRIPGEGKRLISGESTAWCLSEDCPIWLQNNTSNYEGNYYRTTVKSLVSQEDDAARTLGCPVTLERPEGGYALITEASVYAYSGMTLHASAGSMLKAVFQDDLQGWQTEGEILTPWRVTIVTPDLNGLVNTDLITSLGNPPDTRLFPNGVNTDWIRPGKALCTWAVFFNDGAQWSRQKWFVDMCSAMNCEYLLIDGGWRTERWGFLSDGGDLWARLEELCQYAADRKVGIFVWNAYPEGRDDGPGLTDPESRREFFRKCKAAGVQGVKIDFFDSESKAMMEVYECLLRETAELQLMISFHGVNKPAAETRTWPHEITREGIREQEYVLWEQLPLEHYGALPFTRMIAGHGDFLPGFVRPKFLKNTTAVFQLGTAIVYTSPFICWPDHPEAYLESPFLPLIRTMPPTWDETRVLDGSAIGRTVAMARRSGQDWYVAILNCQQEPANYELSLSFLEEDVYEAIFCRDRDGAAGAQQLESGIVVQRGESMRVQMKPGGGFVAKFSRPTSYTE